MSPDTADDPEAGSVPPPLRRVPEARFRDGRFGPGEADLAAEVAISLEYNGTSHAVMLATPSDLEDFALGFSLSEGILERPDECLGIDVEAREQGLVLALEVGSRAFANLRERRRTLAGRTGCGLCGAENLSQVVRRLPPLGPPGEPIAPEAIARASRQTQAGQVLGRQTGATHAASWCSREGEVRMLREDVGRHNALDKLVGAMASSHADPGDGFFFVTSRASIEMVQKSVAARVPLLASVSAPTTLAVDQALQWGLTLVGFVRGEHFAVYTHPQRIRGA